MHSKTARTHHKIISMAEMEQFFSEKSSAEGSVTVVTLTSDGGFTAKNLAVYGRKVILS
jgi:hypothetical protein